MLTSAPAKRTSQAPALLKPPTTGKVDELGEVRRTLAIELAVEAARAEDEGASEEVVEALRAKARSILGHRPGANLAPAPIVLRHAQAGLAVYAQL